MSFNIINPQSADMDTCSICLDKLNKESTYKLPECGHVYHTNCIIHWLRCGHNNCPYCNNNGTNYSSDDNSSPKTYYSKRCHDQYILLRRFSRTKNAPIELKKLVNQLKLLEQKLKNINKEIKSIKNKKGIFKTLRKLYDRKINNKYYIQSRIRNLKKCICENNNITSLILLKNVAS
jgi:hypothetical protein